MKLEVSPTDDLQTFHPFDGRSKRRTFHELNLPSLVRLMNSSKLNGLDLTCDLTS